MGDLERLAAEAKALNGDIAAGERLVQATSEKLDERRLKLGRILAEARKGFPRSGPNAAGWGRFLADIGVGDQSALRYMSLAGFVESSATECGESRVPTYAEAGITKPRAEPPRPPMRLGAAEIAVGTCPNSSGTANLSVTSSRRKPMPAPTRVRGVFSGVENQWEGAHPLVWMGQRT